MRRWSYAGSLASGKTGLLEYAVERAAGCRVFRATGVESEIELTVRGAAAAMALLDRRDALPEPQCEALAIAFDLRSGRPPIACL